MSKLVIYKCKCLKCSMITTLMIFIKNKNILIELICPICKDNDKLVITKVN